MFDSGIWHKALRGGGGARLLAWLLAPWALTVTGCGVWDDFRASDYSVRAYFAKEDPLQALEKSNDGTKRARALEQLSASSGKGQDREFVLTLLIRSASEEPHAVARLAAINSLATFKGPRAAQGLKDAFYTAERFPSPEIRSVVRIQSMNALGRIGDPAAVDLLVDVLRAPKIEAAKSSEAEKQLNLDERLAAAAALANFKIARSTDALVQVLKNEKDPALRDRATDSLRTATGKKLPAEAAAWENALYGETTPRIADQDRKPQGVPTILRTSATEQERQ